MEPTEARRDTLILLVTTLCSTGGLRDPLSTAEMETRRCLNGKMVTVNKKRQLREIVTSRFDFNLMIGFVLR